MSELLVIAIGVLVLVGLVVAARARGASGADPASSVEAFHRALSAMEPGAGSSRAGDEADQAGDEADDGRGDPAGGPGPSARPRGGSGPRQATGDSPNQATGDSPGPR